MMKEIWYLLVLNVAFSSAAFIVQRFQHQSSDNDTESTNNETTINIQFSVFQQKVDHFNLENDRKWNQNAWYSSTYFKDGGPAFLLINGEWAVDGESEFKKSWVSYAKIFNAACFTFEHRFYGKSWPGKETTYRLLNVAQALADIAYFIKTVSEDNPWLKNAKWILFGGSHAGCLAAWARLKYPHLVYGAVASSAPLFSTVNYEDYPRIVEKSLESYDVKCVESIASAIEEIANFTNETENANDIIESLNYDCTYEYKVIVRSLLSSMDYILSNAVQYNDTTNIDIPTVCDIMIDHNGTKLEAFVEVRRKYMEWTKDDAETDDITKRSWEYQRCSEVGGFTFNNNTRYLFGIDQFNTIEATVQNICGQFFGPQFDAEEMHRRMMHTNFLYGGLDYNVANTLFIQGSTDPWYTSGPYMTTEDSLYETILINGTSHCADMFPTTIEQNPNLKAAYEEVIKILKKWLKK